MEIVDPNMVSTPFKTKGKQALVRFKPKFEVLNVPDIPNMPSLTVSPTMMLKVKDELPGYDISYILGIWTNWAAKKAENVKNPDAAFKAFARRYAEANPFG